MIQYCLNCLLLNQVKDALIDYLEKEDCGVQKSDLMLLPKFLSQFLRNSGYFFANVRYISYQIAILSFIAFTQLSFFGGLLLKMAK